MFNEEFKKFVEYISLNSTWLKDVAWIILTLVATIVTILTYRNAKKSIFQPLNTEVIKHQTESFVRIYNLLRGNLIEKFDYFNIFFLNFYAAMIELEKDVTVPSVLSKDLKKMYEDDMPIVVGKSSSKNKKIDRSIENHIVKIDAPKIEAGKEIDVIRVISTSNVETVLDEISQIIEDPFIPKSIKQILEKIEKDAKENYTTILTDQLAKLLNKIWLEDNVNAIEESYCYCNFYMDNINKHTHDRKKLFSKINEHLRINKLFK